MYIKYPRTYHLPYSQTVTDDDKRLSSDDHFKSFDNVVVTIKMDGENTSCYQNGYIHARSIDGNRHEWQHLLKSEIRSWCHDIPENWRVCGENLYARHSIEYTFKSKMELFQVFGIYDDKNMCLSWEDTKTWCSMLNLKTVPEIYVGKYDKDAIMSKFIEYSNNSENEVEGFVVRNAGKFGYDDFSVNVGKYVRANHVRTDSHWSSAWVKNKIVA